MLLSKFLDLGEKAVTLSLSVGIFPYVLKLLQSPASELRPVLVFIWAKLLAVDPSCQNDLLKDNGYLYFIGILGMSDLNLGSVANSSEHRAMCAFVLSVFCRNFLGGQHACLKNGLLQSVVPHLKDHDPLLRQWSCVCLTQFWTGFTEAKKAAVESGVHIAVASLICDPLAEVRTAAISALGSLFGGLQRSEPGMKAEELIVSTLLKTLSDASPMVRKEVAIAFSHILAEYHSKTILAAIELIEEERISTKEDSLKISKSNSAVTNFKHNDANKNTGKDSIFKTILKMMLCLSIDPHPAVAISASKVIDAIMSRVASSTNIDILSFNNKPNDHRMLTPPSPSFQYSSGSKVGRSSSPLNVTVPAGLRPMTSVPILKRTTSFALSFRNFANYVGIPGTYEYSFSPLSNPVHRRNNPVIRPSSMVDLSSINLGKAPEQNKFKFNHLPDTFDAEQIELHSDFYDWSCDYFREPQMAVYFFLISDFRD